MGKAVIDGRLALARKFITWTPADI